VPSWETRQSAGDRVDDAEAACQYLHASGPRQSLAEVGVHLQRRRELLAACARLTVELNSTYYRGVVSAETSRGSVARQNLLNAAAKELSETGELEVAAVARRAGVSVGLPYRYFGTRTGLLIAILDAFYDRLCDAAALRDYDESTWAAREQHRIRDWVTFLYAEPLAPIVLGGLVGDGEVAAAHTSRLSLLIEIGARNMARAQRSGELPSDRDPEYLAAATLGGTNAVVSIALTRTPRPAAESVISQLWKFVSGAVGVAETGRNTR